MNDDLLNKQQRKKARRKQRRDQEKQAHRDLDAATGMAVQEALRLAPIVTSERSVRAIDVELASPSEAQFVRKRVNDAMRVAEWLSEVRVEIWTADDGGKALTERGASQQLELRLTRAID